MSPTFFALAERAHGHLALLALALLTHPVVWARPRATPPRVLPRRVQTTATLAALGLVLVFAAGWWLYPTYRGQVKPSLFLTDNPAWLRFETKEHLAAFSAALAVAGAGVLRWGGLPARRTAWTLLLLAWLTGLATAALGLWVASQAHPGWVG